MEHYLHCCFTVSKAPAVYWVTECVTCDNLQLYFVSNFMPHISHQISHAMASFECSFRGHSKKECGISARYKHQTALLPLKTCKKGIFDHLNGCFKTTSRGVEVEWQLCLYRAGLFDKAGDSLTICELIVFLLYQIRKHRPRVKTKSSMHFKRNVQGLLNMCSGEPSMKDPQTKPGRDHS